MKDAENMTEQEKQDILSMDEVTSYFLINECGAFIFKITHDISKGVIAEAEQHAVMTDVNNIRSLQKFAVDNLMRFGVDPETVNDRENGDYWKWYKHWDNWKNNLPEESWKLVSEGKYKEHLPKKSWNEEDSSETSQ